MESQPEPAANEARTANRRRFELELEFVQSLANPFYLNSLAQQGLLSQPAFINFLTYLLYWKEKDYARFILYPHALHHLELLQHPEFRSAIGKDNWREILHQKQFDHWRTWRDPNRIQTADPPSQLDGPSGTSGAGPPAPANSQNGAVVNGS
ncbi:SOH1-domain-containing protein [Epithele typhae]|uniref:SOH1-domain-containing protein n=1 Tax=Epithele typhae TaxID=378194 RepID=UPI002008456B|nr:SOH1-domain-containing protein [Epithele typhae]KAH9940464.1 SOH1-domain-containing protein [Epithele typhae]